MMLISKGKLAVLMDVPYRELVTWQLTCTSQRVLSQNLILLVALVMQTLMSALWYFNSNLVINLTFLKRLQGR